MRRLVASGTFTNSRCVERHVANRGEGLIARRADRNQSRLPAVRQFAKMQRSQIDLPQLVGHRQLRSGRIAELPISMRFMPIPRREPQAPFAHRQRSGSVQHESVEREFARLSGEVSGRNPESLCAANGVSAARRWHSPAGHPDVLHAGRHGRLSIIRLGVVFRLLFRFDSGLLFQRRKIRDPPVAGTQWRNGNRRQPPHVRRTQLLAGGDRGEPHARDE